MDTDGKLPEEVKISRPKSSFRKTRATDEIGKPKRNQFSILFPCSVTSFKVLVNFRQNIPRYLFRHTRNNTQITKKMIFFFGRLDEREGVTRGDIHIFNILLTFYLSVYTDKNSPTVAYLKNTTYDKCPRRHVQGH